MLVLRVGVVSVCSGEAVFCTVSSGGVGGVGVKAAAAAADGFVWGAEKEEGEGGVLHVPTSCLLFLNSHVCKLHRLGVLPPTLHNSHL